MTDALAPEKPRMRLISFRPIGKNGIAGFAAVELGIGLRLFDLPVFSCGQSRPWAALTRKPQLDRERRQRFDANGKPAFEPVAEWRDRQTADHFPAALIELVRAAHPDVFEDLAA